MAETTGLDLILVAFQALDREEQTSALQQMHEHHLRLAAGVDSEEGRLIRSLRRAAEYTEADPLTVDAYRRAVAELKTEGEELEPLSRVIRCFGSWRQAREALQLSENSTARAIAARFAKRRLDKIWRYTEESLAEAMRQCVEDLGHVPQVAEYEHWRERKLALARAQGDDALHLPSNGPFRRRLGGSWEKALLGLGYMPDEVAERLER